VSYKPIVFDAAQNTLFWTSWLTFTYTYSLTELFNWSPSLLQWDGLTELIHKAYSLTDFHHWV